MGASTSARGYGWAHQQRRARLAPLVNAGMYACARCGERILPGALWDLGHVDESGKTRYSGPEHRRCNRQTELHGVKRARAQTLVWSRIWFEPIPANVVLAEACRGDFTADL